MSEAAPIEIKFLFVGEGSSDRQLVSHLQTLCVRAGASEAQGDAPDLGRLTTPPGKAIEAQSAAALRLAGTVDLLFVHQDADRRDPSEVRTQIRSKLATISNCPPHICVVPVQELEAWLLVDEPSIRAVVGRPSGKKPLGIPPLAKIEAARQPKEVLQRALVTAAEATGARLRRTREAFSAHRMMLFQRLDIEGMIRDLPSWQQLERDVESAITALGRTKRKR
jgi:hypothetical protein